MILWTVGIKLHGLLGFIYFVGNSHSESRTWGWGIFTWVDSYSEADSPERKLWGHMKVCHLLQNGLAHSCYMTGGSRHYILLRMSWNLGRKPPLTTSNLLSPSPFWIEALEVRPKSQPVVPPEVLAGPKPKPSLSNLTGLPKSSPKTTTWLC